MPGILLNFAVVMHQESLKCAPTGSYDHGGNTMRVKSSIN
jgi:hypothetical protein